MHQMIAGFLSYLFFVFWVSAILRYSLTKPLFMSFLTFPLQAFEGEANAKEHVLLYKCQNVFLLCFRTVMVSYVIVI